MSTAGRETVRTAPPPPDMRYFAKCWAISAACVLGSAAALALGAPKVLAVTLATTGITLVVVALLRTLAPLLR